MSVFGHYIKKHNPSLSESKHCLAGGGKRCPSPVEFMIGYTYTKEIFSRNGKRVDNITTRKAACRWHATRFAKKNNLHVPV